MTGQLSISLTVTVSRKEWQRAFFALVFTVHVRVIE